MLKLAKLLHHRGFHVTFVNTDYNHSRLLRTRGDLAGLPSFRFATIPDGMPPSDTDVTQDIPALCESTRRTCLPHFKGLLADLNHTAGVPPVSCIVSDGVMSFTLDAAADLGIPEVLFWTTSACGFLGYMHYRDLIQTGLKHDVLAALSAILPPVYSIGSLSLLSHNQITDPALKSISSSLWKEETECLRWLDAKQPNSVLYVNFGSITVMTNSQLVEFAWGLANSRKPFLWVIRPDLVAGETAMLPPEFVAETGNRGLLAKWCPQEEVLNHPSVAGFLTHNGWNSTLESICSGVPMICWPFFAEQQTNCKFACDEWGVGMEIDSDVKRDEVEGLVRELMEGGKGEEMRRRAAEWKTMAVEATTAPSGSSVANLDKLVQALLLSPCQ
ncbi:unnamed protein product [Linum tenue]|uniref:Uncharacterized protein n=1 Tax=Linum tenue TaxID=586396 RepID=A0AAV0MHG7_9ROSI|nr:unnamed protein product [Linum tenue]